MSDNINPDHYKSSTSLECIEAMELVFGVDATYKFCICNAWKYIWRWKNKNGEEDLKKAMWYIERAEGYFDDEVYIYSKILDNMRYYISAHSDHIN